MTLLDPSTVWVLIPIAAIGVGAIKTLSKHQMQIAQIVHGQNQTGISSQEASDLREDMKQLRELVHQQTIALDNLRDDIKATQNVQNRITENS